MFTPTPPPPPPPRGARSSSTPSTRPPPTSRRPSTASPRRSSAGARGVTLLGATGTGKTMTMAATIERLQRPALVIAHNKTLAAQLCNEFRTYFPSNAVEYFVSYYDYYQPEAYVPSRDLYIEKDSAINQEIDRLRHAATARAVRAPRRRDRRVGLVHLRPRLAGDLQRELPGAGQGRLRRPRRAAAQARLAPVQPQRHRRSGAARSASAATRWRSSRPTRRPRSGRCCSATRSSACSTSTR